MSDDKKIASQDVRKASSIIADEILNDIQSGALTPGLPLPTERELCQKYDASRPTIREALSRIELMGFLEVSAGKTPRVHKPTLQDVLSNSAGIVSQVLGEAESGAHLEQMRQFVEVGAVRETTKRATNVQIQKIKSALDENCKSIGTTDFAPTDILFHRSIVAVVGNPVLLTLHDLFVSRLLSTRSDKPNQVDRERMIYSEHLAIFEAILSCDEVLSTELMDRHLARSYRERLSAPIKLRDES